jgi:acetyl esterase/lipase
MSEFRPRPPSARAQVAHLVTRLTVRPLEHLVPEGPTGIKVTRRLIEGLMVLGGGAMAPGVTMTPVDLQAPAGRIKGEWLRPANARTDGVILYIHGSGYNLCSTRTHRPLVSRIAARTRLAVYSTEYRLAPEHVFPAAADDIERAYDWLVAQGWRPDQIIVAGDSAGGHLTLDVALLQVRAGRPSPAGLVMLSPLSDSTCDLMEMRERMIPDPMISADGVRRILAHYFGDTDPRHPRLTHVVEAHETLPPTLIQAGGAEFLAADAHRMADQLRGSGTEVSLEIWPGQMHVFQALDRLVPEAEPALARACDFMTRTLDARQAAPGTAQVTA